MSDGSGGGGIIIIHPHAIKVPPTVSVCDLQAWAESLDETNPLKPVLTDYLASIPTQ
jgi:hypothetical protein